MSAAVSLQRPGYAALIASVMLLALTACAVTVPPPPSPLIDVHLHYNWDQAELIEPERAVQRLQAAGVLLEWLQPAGVG